MTRSEILAEFRKLDPEEQRQLVEEMRESIDDDVSHEYSEEELAEIERRAAEFEADPSTGVPWEVLREELRKRHD